MTFDFSNKLESCDLTEKCCKALASALNSSHLREVDLSYNPLKDSEGLGSPHCKLEKLRSIFLSFLNIRVSYCSIDPHVYLHLITAEQYIERKVLTVNQNVKTFSPLSFRLNAYIF